jgi:prevent-host-death family protein
MKRAVSKSKFKARALEYFRDVESTGKSLIITDRGRAVLKIVPYADDPAGALTELRGSVLKYDNPTDPVGLEDWDVLR